MPPGQQQRECLNGETMFLSSVAQLPFLRVNVHSLNSAPQHEGWGMRRANIQAQSDRRAEILAAAQRCFVRSGFHGASMQDICAEAGMSPGNLYRYFPSKEAL